MAEDANDANEMENVDRWEKKRKMMNEKERIENAHSIYIVCVCVSRMCWLAGVGLPSSARPIGGGNDGWHSCGLAVRVARCDAPQ